MVCAKNGPNWYDIMNRGRRASTIIEGLKACRRDNLSERTALYQCAPFYWKITQEFLVFLCVDNDCRTRHRSISHQLMVNWSNVEASCLFTRGNDLWMDGKPKGKVSLAFWSMKLDFPNNSTLKMSAPAMHYWWVALKSSSSRSESEDRSINKCFCHVSESHWILPQSASIIGELRSNSTRVVIKLHKRLRVALCRPA